MLSFQTFSDGKPSEHWPLRNVYLIGADGNPMRSDIRFERGKIICEKREAGTAALALQHRVGDLGELTLQTTQLPESSEPYLLNLELARHRLMVLLTKLEDWQMFELESTHPATRRIEHARKLFIEALCRKDSDLVRADQLAQDCLIAALDGSEELALAHSETLLNRRKENGGMPRFPLGCGVSIVPGCERIREGLLNQFDFVQLPTPWKLLTPEEGDFNFEQVDAWVDAAVALRKPIVAGPLVNFESHNLPDWAYIWEHDFEQLRDLIYEYVEKVVTRYGSKVAAWNVASGLHINQHFALNLDQIIDLTRMVVMQVKKLRPNAIAMIELRQPFGEYYGQNPRSIPPVTYAELVSDSSINFDAFSVRIAMGQSMQGYYTRDLMQLSGLLDQFSVFNKPIYISMSVPSQPITSMMVAMPDRDEPVDDNSGFWRRPWSPTVQSHWSVAMMQIAMSKPYIDAVTWQEVVDHPDIVLPLSGLINEQLQPKPSFRKLLQFREQLITPGDGRIDANSLLGSADTDKAKDGQLPKDGFVTPSVPPGGADDPVMDTSD